MVQEDISKEPDIEAEIQMIIRLAMWKSEGRNCVRSLRGQ